METNLKKILSVFGVVCFSMGIAHADSGCGFGCKPACKPTCKYEEKEVNNCPIKYAVPPAKYPGGENSPCFLISAAYTLWTARQDGLAYAVTGYNSPANSQSCCGKVLYPKDKLRSGFKVGLGMFLDQDNWDTQVNYTWFYNKKNGYTAECFEGAYSTWPILPQTDINDAYCDDAFNYKCLAEACARWNNWFNRIDMTLGRTFYAGHYHTLRAYLGLLAAWEEQNFDINYQSLDIGPWTAVRNDQKWWGIGPYTGISPEYIFPPCGCEDSQFSIFSNLGIAMPWGKANSRIKTSEGELESTTDSCNSNSCDPCDPCSEPCSGCPQVTTGCNEVVVQCTKDSFWNIMPMAEVSLGLRWEMWTECDWNFLLEAAWETQVYFDHNYMKPSVGAQRSMGNYSMQGLTIRAQFGW